VEVVRFKNPNKVVRFHDEIRGDIEVDTTDLGDFVIARNMSEPLYHLSVVVDDFLMGVTHIMRGDDGISNTPRQILIQEAIGAPRPIYAHLPLVLASDRSKLSKRKHGASVSLEFYKNAGYLPEAMVNFLALLGWNPGNDEEILTMPMLIEKFDITKVQKGGAIFNIEKLNWFNKEHLKMKPWTEVEAEIVKRLDLPSDISSRIAPTIFERINTYGDIEGLKKSGELDYYKEAPMPAADNIVWAKGNATKEETKTYLIDIISLLENIDNGNFTVLSVKEKIFPYAEERGRGNVLWPVRFSLSGKERSPDPFTLAYILGKDETIKRLRAAADILI
jgi:glutamyl/glutaminyl-tRNA synthetase